jgi:metal-responsive CopG/Arc/MetJ family transcriptional regulator
MKKKLNVSIPEEIMESLDAEAKKMGLDRTNMVTMCITSYIEQRQAMSIMNNLDLKKVIEILGDSKK